MPGYVGLLITFLSLYFHPTHKAKLSSSGVLKLGLSIPVMVSKHVNYSQQSAASAAACSSKSSSRP